MTTNLDYVNQHVEAGLNDLIRAAGIAAKIGTEDEKNIIKYINLAEQLMDVKRDAKSIDRALILCKEADSVGGVENIFRDAKAENNKGRASHSSLKEFKQRIETILGGNNLSVISENLETTQSAFNDIDPITKRKIEYPVVNKICKHIYDRSSVFEAIQLNKRMRCPVVGCGNNQHVSKSHIIDDPAAVNRIRASQQGTMDITL